MPHVYFTENQRLVNIALHFFVLRWRRMRHDLLPTAMGNFDFRTFYVQPDHRAFYRIIELRFRKR